MRQADNQYRTRMVRRAFRFGLVVGIFGGLAWALRRTFDLRNATSDVPVSRQPWTPIHETSEPVREPATAPPATDEPPTPAPLPDWVEPSGTSCPVSHPIKAKLASGLFHAPGMLAYNRTRPDRCYIDESAAIADGFTRAKR
jgi:hypothetical protein